mgnify:CR=1 FL=1
MIPSWAHDVKPEDITNATMLDLAELLGTENMLTLVESYQRERGQAQAANLAAEVRAAGRALLSDRGAV